MTSTGNIIHLFLNAADIRHDKTALIYGDEAITYKGLSEKVKKTAHCYQQCGIGKGDKVLVFVPMSIDLYRIVLALFYIGACPVFIDEWVKLDRLKKCCSLVPCKALIAPRWILLLSYFIKEFHRINIKILTHRSSNNTLEAPAEVNGNDTALITFTTGSTGIPKAANRTHDFLHAQFAALTPLMDNEATISLVTLPIVVLINLGLGKTTVLPPPGFSIRKKHTTPLLTKSLSTSNADSVICSPSILNRIHATSAGTFPSVQFAFTGGGAVFPDHATVMLALFPNAQNTIVYGSTEAEPISHINTKAVATFAEDISQTGLPVGQPHKSVNITIIPYSNGDIPQQTAESWKQMSSPPGVVGEIVVTGDHVLKEYIDNPVAMARNKVIVDGRVWHRTGDAGRLDKDNMLYFYGLCKEIIQWKGRVFYPLLTSYSFCALSGAERVALLVHNHQLTLVLEKSPVKESSISEALKQLNLDDVKIVYTDEIPLDPRHLTKIDYEKLREKLGYKR